MFLIPTAIFLGVMLVTSGIPWSKSQEVPVLLPQVIPGLEAVLNQSVSTEHFQRTTKIELVLRQVAWICCDGQPFHLRLNYTDECVKIDALRTCNHPQQGYLIDPQTAVVKCQSLGCQPRSHKWQSLQIVGQSPVCQMEKWIESLCSVSRGMHPRRILGVSICECLPGHLYWPPDDRCYRAHYQGPCQTGHKLVLSEHSARPACVLNPCHDNGTVEWPGTGQCHQLDNSQDSPCGDSRMEVDPNTLQLVCETLRLHALITPPSQLCRPGSRALRQGLCGIKVAISSTSSSVFPSDYPRRNRNTDNPLG